MYYLSHYNSYVKTQEGILVYNTKYQNAIRLESNSIEAVKDYLVHSAPKELIDMGYVCTDKYEIEEEKYQYQKIKYSTDVLNIMLIMTYMCNCQCQYCFENLDDSFIYGNEDIDAVIEMISGMYRANKYSRLELHFFGGEPTMKTKEMIYIIDQLKKERVNVIPNVITNGILLTKEVISMLIEAEIKSYQITIDGPASMHDKRRPMKNGDSAWKYIIDNLEYMSGKHLSITLRINIDKENVNYLKDICDLLPKSFLEHKYSNIYIAPVVGCMTKSTVLETLQERAETIKHAWKIISENKLPIVIQPPTYYPCPYDSCESAFYIDLYGNIYTCGGYVGKKDKIERVGYLKSDKFFQRVNQSPQEHCFACEFGPVCLGGCRFEGDVLGAECQYQYLKEVYDEYFMLYA